MQPMQQTTTFVSQLTPTVKVADVCTKEPEVMESADVSVLRLVNAECLTLSEASD